MMMVMIDSFAMVLYAVYVVNAIANHVILVVAIGFPSMTALLKLMDDLEGVLMIIVFKVVVVVVWHMTMGHEPVPDSSTRDHSAKYRMWVSEGTMRKWTAVSR